jgi:hypothetical protein
LDESSPSRVGALRHVTSQKVIDAVGEVRTGEVISLNRPLSEPPLGGRPPLKRTVRQHNQVRQVDGHRYVLVNDDVVEFATQGSSQWDSLAHVGVIEPGREGVFFDGIGLDETFPEPNARRLGIQVLSPGLVTRGVLLDIPRLLGGPDCWALDLSITVDADMVIDCLKAQKTTVEEGDALLVYTGYEQAWGSDEALGMASPGFDETTMRLWADWRISALASDNVGVERTPVDYSLHIGALCELGLHLGELWALRELAERCRDRHRWSFLLASVPLNIPGAFGSPANAIAVL